MARKRCKADLPIKTCVVCGRPFTWRKKWAHDWENVRYCSQRCRAAASRSASGPRLAQPCVLRIILGDHLSLGLAALADLDPGRDTVLMMEVEEEKHPRPATTREVMALVERRFPDHFGGLKDFGWPVTRADAVLALDDFIAHGLSSFGDYQDAMKAGAPAFTGP